MKRNYTCGEPQSRRTTERRWKSIFNVSLFLLLFVGWGGMSSAQTVQIGSGTSTTTSLPINYNWGYNYTQTIYTAAEMVTAGMDPSEGFITKIRYKATVSRSTALWQDWTIFLGNTTKDGFDTTSDWVAVASMNEVFDGQIPANVVAGQWMEITLTTPFQWDGTSNIVIGINETTPSFGNNPSWSSYTLAPSAGNKSLYKTVDGAAFDPLSPPSGTRSNIAPQIQFDGNLMSACAGTPSVGVITGPADACFGSNVILEGVIVANSGIIYQWQESANGTTWTDIVGATGTNHTVLGGITANTHYRLEITCSNGGASSFSNELLVEFKSGAVCICIPVGASNNTDEIRNFTLNNLDNSSAASEGTAGYSDYTTSVSAALLNRGVSYTASLLSGAGSGNHGATIWIDFNDNGVFEASERVASIASTIGANSTVSFPSFIVPLTAPLGQHHLRVQYTHNLPGASLNPCIISTSYSETEDYLVDILAAPTCLPPTALMVANSIGSSTDLGWTESGTASAWIIEYGTVGFVPGNGTIVNASTNPQTIVTTPETQYEFYVRADCGGSDLSSWSGPFAFTTPCLVTTAPFYEGFNNAVQPDCWSNLSSSSSTLADNFWRFNKQGENGALANGKLIGTFAVSDGSTPNPDSMMLISPRIDISTLTNPALSFEWFSNNTNAPGNNVPLIIEVFDGTSWHYIDTLKGNNPLWVQKYYDLSTFAGGTIQVRFMTNQSGVTSAFQNDILIDEVRIDEMISCIPISDLLTTSISTITADVSWTAGGTESAWNISWGTPGYTPGDANEIATGSSTSTSFQLTGLTEETSYDVYVQANCGGTDQSTWYGPLSFTTPCTPYSIPYFEGFENGYTHNTMVEGCLTQDSEAGTSGWLANNTLITYNRVPRTDDWNAFLGYGNTDWMFIPISLVGGTAYVTDVYVRQDGANSANASISISYGSAANFAAMTDVIVPSTGIINGDYQLVSGVFTPSTSGVYYIGIKGEINSSPWYISMDDIAVYEAPSCFPITNLVNTATSAATADITWTAGGTESAWNISWGTPGYTPGDVNEIANNPSTANSYSITGLTDNTEYDVYVQADCGLGDESTWFGPVTFTTTCLATNVPYTQDFESANTPNMPSCTSTENVGTGNNWTTASNTTSGFNSKGLRYSYNTSNAADTWFYTQGVNLTAGTEYVISYDYGDNGYEEKLKVAYGISPSSTSMTTTLDDHTTLGNQTLQSNAVLFTPTSTDVYYFGFNAHSASNQFYLFLDNILVDLAPVCDDPSVLTAANITPTSADLAWTENGSSTSWNIEYGETGFAQGSGTTIGVTTNPYTLTGLDVNTDYEFYVQSDCGVLQSALVGPIAFTTLCVASTGIDTKIECETFTWIDGNVYTASNNVATHTLVGGAANGCDSIVTLNLTINYSVSGVDVIETCAPSITWIDGSVYTTNNSVATHTISGGSATGCDSIVTLNLTFVTSVTGIDTQVECETFTWIDGNVYTASNSVATYTLVNGSVDGCDSIVTLNLTIKDAATGVDTKSACETFTWIDGNVYTASNNVATHTILGGAANGCDSIVTLNLTIDNLNSAGNNNTITICKNEPVDLATLLSSGADTGGTWLDAANAPLTSTVVTGSTTAGDYLYSYVVSSTDCPDATAVFTVTVDAGCDYLSTSNEMLIDVSVYPNPATSTLTIVNPSNTSSLKVEMLDMNGRVVLVENKALNNATEATVTIDYLERGIYTLRVYNDEVQRTFKVVKQ